MELLVGLALITAGTAATLALLLAVAAAKRRLHRVRDIPAKDNRADVTPEA